MRQSEQRRIPAVLMPAEQVLAGERKHCGFEPHRSENMKSLRSILERDASGKLRGFRYGTPYLGWP